MGKTCSNSCSAIGETMSQIFVAKLSYFMFVTTK